MFFTQYFISNTLCTSDVTLSVLQKATSYNLHNDIPNTLLYSSTPIKRYLQKEHQQVHQNILYIPLVYKEFLVQNKNRAVDVPKKMCYYDSVCKEHIHANLFLHVFFVILNHLKIKQSLTQKKQITKRLHLQICKGIY